MITIAPHPLHSIQRFGRTPSPYSGDPCLCCSDYRAPTILAGVGEIGVFRVAFVPLACIDTAAPFTCAEDVVLIGVDTLAKLTLPKTLQFQTNLDFLFPRTGETSALIAEHFTPILQGLGLRSGVCEVEVVTAPYAGRIRA